MQFCSMMLLDIHLAHSIRMCLFNSVEQIQQVLIKHLLCTRCLFPLKEKSSLSSDSNSGSSLETSLLFPAFTDMCQMLNCSSWGHTGQHSLYSVLLLWFHMNPYLGNKLGESRGCIPTLFSLPYGASINTSHRIIANHNRIWGIFLTTVLCTSD